MKLLPAFFLLLTVVVTEGQTNPGGTALVEEPLEKVDTSTISANGRIALSINPDKWKHAETPNFILHFRRLTEARKVAREIEFDLACIAKVLGARPADYARKSHVYVFADQQEWTLFVSQSGFPSWAVSYALGDELFLNVRQDDGSFDSKTLAHETTHAVIARIYRSQHWPLWLNEGFAEYMGGAAVAERKNQTIGSHQRRLDQTDLPLEEMACIREYPESELELARLYQTGECFVRFLMAKNPPERFVPFANQLTDGKTLPEAIAAIYGDKYKDFATFQKAFETFRDRG